MDKLSGIQLYMSNSLKYWEKAIEDRYKTVKYTDKSKPCLFFGILDIKDVETINRHLDYKYILLQGNELINRGGARLIDKLAPFKDTMFLTLSNFIAEKLKILHMKIDINFNIVNSGENCQRDSVIVYSGFSRNDESKYNIDIYDKIIEKLPKIKFVLTSRLGLDYIGLTKLYRACFAGLYLPKSNIAVIDHQFVNDLRDVGVITNIGGDNCIGHTNVENSIDQISLLKFLSKFKYRDIVWYTDGPVNNKSVLYSIKKRGLYEIKIHKFRSNRTSMYIYCRGIFRKILDSDLRSDFDININYVKIDRPGILIIRELVSFEKMTVSSCDDLVASENTKFLDIPPVKTYKTQHNRRFKVGCILDSFSYVCFSYELNLVLVTPNNWNSGILLDIDFFLCESAWHGNNEAWAGMLTNKNNKTVVKLMKYLDKLKIPKVFYNKEDPVNYKSFEWLAKLFTKENNCVVTTDRDMIEQYKKLGCHNVTSFPFCCQPVLHNPVGSRVEIDKFVFPCTYYAAKYPERCRIMDSMLDSIDRVDIYDRKFLYNKQRIQIPMPYEKVDYYRFSQKYRDKIKGSLDYKQVLYLYKKYRGVLNVNTIVDSPTMFSRRVMEAGAMRTAVVSNRAAGIDSVLGDLVYIYDDKERVDKMLEDDEYRDNIADKLSNKILREYTYKNLINSFVGCIFKKNVQKKVNRVLCLVFGKKEVDFPNCMFEFNFSLEACKDFDYCAIISDKYSYSKTYIEDSLLPALYTDSTVFGRASYKEGDTYIYKELEHQFTNKLNIYSLVFKINDMRDVLEGDIIDNLELYLDKQFDGNNMYSGSRFGFCRK